MFSALVYEKCGKYVGPSRHISFRFVNRWIQALSPHWELGVSSISDQKKIHGLSPLKHPSNICIKTWAKNTSRYKKPHPKIEPYVHHLWVIYGLHPFIMTKSHMLCSENSCQKPTKNGPENVLHLGPWDPWADVKTKRKGARSNT